MERYVSKHRAVRRHRASHVRRQQGFVAAAIFTAVVGTVVMATETDAWASDFSSDVDWDAVAACESGGNWSISTGNNFYGGLQFSLATWRAHGGVGMPNQASREQQIAVANRVLATQGIGAWPVCGKRAGSTAPRHAAPSAPKQTNGIYTVVSGDTLGSIAAKLNVAGGWEALRTVNSGVVSDPSLIFPGQHLSLP